MTELEWNLVVKLCLSLTIYDLLRRKLFFMKIKKEIFEVEVVLMVKGALKFDTLFIFSQLLSCLDLLICDLVNHLTARMDKMKQNDRNQFYFEIFHSISRYQQTQGVQILAATSCLEIEKNASCAVNFVCCQGWVCKEAMCEEIFYLTKKRWKWSEWHKRRVTIVIPGLVNLIRNSPTYCYWIKTTR